MKKTVMKEVVIRICDYCGEEITDYSWTGGDDTDFHNMYAGGSKVEVKKTCYDKHCEEKDANTKDGGKK